jgi:uncharacterized protein YbbC (DUF1343 family)
MTKIPPPLLCAALGLALLLALGRPARAATISLGIDELEKTHFAVLQGKRVGLVTNPSGADSKGHSAIDVLYHGTGFKLVKLFGPEHGIYGAVNAGESFGDTRDRLTGLHVYALYNSPSGDHRHPTPAMFAGLDAIVYDVQDLGNRSYTFISTLGFVMDEAAKDGVEVIVLDRPNPLGGQRIEGPRLVPGDESFVGLYDIPLVYGLTPGELAQWINAHYLARPCRLTVVRMAGWTRRMVWEDTGLRWIPTSPNIPSIGAARGYTATGFLGEIGIETGIGGPLPFEVVSGRGWNTAELARRFNALQIPGVRATPYRYRSQSDRWGSQTYEGVRLAMNPWSAGNLSAISLQAIEILENSVAGFSAFARTDSEQRQMFDKVTGDPSIRRQLIAGRPVRDMARSWNSGVIRWAQERLPYLLYGDTPRAPMTIATSSTGGGNAGTGSASGGGAMP